MRRVAIQVALVGLGVASLASPAAAIATPLVGFRVKAVPIVGFPGTGNLFGAGAALQFEFSVTGTEYSGSAPPLQSFALRFPEGLVWRPADFPTCAPSTLEGVQAEPAACPPGSTAGRGGTISVMLAVGSKLVPEDAILRSFYESETQLGFFIAAQEPAVLAVPLHGSFTVATGLYGHELLTELPLLETVLGAPDMSITGLQTTFGTAIKEAGKTVYYLRLPKTCPPGGFPFQLELDFAAVEGLPPQRVSSQALSPCPRALVPVEPIVTPPPTPPPPKPCTSNRDFVIHIARIPGVRLRSVSVTFRGRPVRVLRGPMPSARIDLRGLPKGLYTVRIALTTSNGRRITSTRSYRTCTPAVSARRTRRTSPSFSLSGGAGGLARRGA
jgi:hypothetical protein